MMPLGMWAGALGDGMTSADIVTTIACTLLFGMLAWRALDLLFEHIEANARRRWRIERGYHPDDTERRP